MRFTIFTILGLALVGCQAPMDANDGGAMPSGTPESVALGRFLFFDPRLSVDDTISCASCHQSSAAFGSTTAVSVGVRGQRGTRKAPPLVNLSLAPRPLMFWDGRAASLEEQASAPIVNPIEMGMTEATVLAKLQAIAEYAAAFERAFGSATITVTNLRRAIADYERTRLSNDSPFDKWQANRASPYSAAAQQGFRVFNRVGCDRCHGGPTFSDAAFHNTGVGFDTRTQAFADSGRFGVTGRAADRGAFKTPTLRDLTVRAPYMHDGSIATLAAVVTFYDNGGIANPNLDRRMRPLNLSAGDKAALVTFLEMLSGEGYADEGPETFPQ